MPSARGNALGKSSVSSSVLPRRDVSGGGETGVPLGVTSTSPAWVEKMVLEAREARADAVVAQDGTGDFNTIGEAIAAAPQQNIGRHVIHVKRGLYDETLRISNTTWNLTLVGDGIDATIITGNRSVDRYRMPDTATVG
ncbi:hypothetical protein PR202_ga12772 [Eleusine coracana subsp. coracana]|uniref:Pectinesterase catalytic domain-containing protein n=1 Tax=Eleusine coracana subsp. coracana TaxID=191504 RepID=A0AAV5CCI5_ELECO|nr:hypothetical protein PR202_ga12772 [Eleusine coracana subsp. coracana]